MRSSDPNTFAGDRHVEAGRLLEQQRRTAARRLAGAVGDGGDLEVGADRLRDPREQLPLVEVGDESRSRSAYIVSASDAAILSGDLLRQRQARGGRASPVTSGARSVDDGIDEVGQLATERLLVGHRRRSPPWIDGIAPSPLCTSRHTSTFCAA